ncbi:GDSL esterase/lipase, partial [Mucuna pruriens]
MEFTDGSNPVRVAMDSKNVVVVAFQVVTFCICLAVANSIDLSFPAVFNFGDSNSDTGELAAGLGFLVIPPNGQNYFKTPYARFCDGRLMVDFLMDAMKLPFLNAYLDSVGLPNFQHGCNFAASGSTILPATASSLSPFSFRVQSTLLFISFIHSKENHHNNVSVKKFDQSVPTEEYFKKGLYMFDIGQNDLAGAFYSKTLDQQLYDLGARNFWIHNTGPLGCLSQVIATFGTDPSKLDELGCLTSHNQAAKAFNIQLQASCSKLKGQYPDANVTLVDIFAIKLDLIANHSKYGFEQPIMACCGYGGPPLNYDSRVPCGLTKTLNGTTITSKSCNNSKVYVNWDGTHYTEAANQYVASHILTGNYSSTLLADKMPFLL